MPQYKSLDELCDFINSTDTSDNKSSELKENLDTTNTPKSSPTLNSKETKSKKVLKKKIIKKKVLKSSINSQVSIEEQTVEEFKKFMDNLQSQNQNREHTKKLKPKISQEWLSSLTSK